MFRILTLNKIAACGVNRLPSGSFAVSVDEKAPDGIILRSFDMHGMETPGSLLAVARAGAGTNNIPVEKYSEAGIAVFNTPGANANAVKELVIASLLISSRRIVSGVNWVNGKKGESGIPEAVEKGKAEFAGPEIMGKTLGVIGVVGAIGAMVANACASLGMNVIGCDPMLNDETAKRLDKSVVRAASIDEFTNCDYITVHVPLIAGNKGMFDEKRLYSLKRGVRIINTSRADIADDAAMVKAVADGQVSCYVTDFPTDALAGVDGVITVPHLGASTPESEDNCAIMAADQIKDYLENGNVKNSVNYPNCEKEFTGGKRVTAVYRSDARLDFSGDFVSKTRGGYGYLIMDAEGGAAEKIAEELTKTDGVIRVRIINRPGVPE